MKRVATIALGLSLLWASPSSASTQNCVRDGWEFGGTNACVKSFTATSEPQIWTYRGVRSRDERLSLADQFTLDNREFLGDVSDDNCVYFARRDTLRIRQEWECGGRLLRVRYWSTGEPAEFLYRFMLLR